MLEGNGKTQGGNREALQENLNLVQSQVVKAESQRARQKSPQISSF